MLKQGDRRRLARREQAPRPLRLPDPDGRTTSQPGHRVPDKRNEGIQMNKVGRRLPLRDTPPEPGTDCLAAVALPQARFPKASTTTTIVTRLLQPPPGDGAEKGHLAIELY